MCGKGTTTSTSSTSPTNASTSAAYQDVVSKAQQVYANQPYQAYTGQLTAGLNDNQNTAIQNLQNSAAVGSPYYDAASNNYSAATSALQAVNPYLQAGSQAAAGALGYGSQAAQTAAGASQYMNNASQLYSTASQQNYMNPYTSSVIDSTMALAHQNDAMQQAQLDAQSIGSGNFGGDRAGIAKAVLSGQQQLADSSTIANLNAQNYTQATAARQADAAGQAGLAGTALNQANVYGNLANSTNQTASLYNSLGQTQGNVAQAYTTNGNAQASTGTARENAYIAGNSAALQGGTLQQQNAQAQDDSAYSQYQKAQSYPFQTTGWLSNIVQGIGSQEGNTTSTSTPVNYLSQGLGAATSGVGILGATGAFGSSGWLSSMLADGGRVRPKFADGGYTSTDGLGSASGFSTDPSNLTNPNFAGIAGTTALHGRPSQPVQPVGIVSGNPSAPSTGGLGSASAGGAGGQLPPTSSVGAGFRNANGDISQNAWLGLAAAGAGMMANNGPGLAGVGAGLQQGLATYSGLQNADRNAAVQQQELGLRSGSLAIDQQRANQDAQRLQQEAAIQKAQLDNQTSQIQSEITQRNREAVTMQPTPYGPGGEPGYIVTNRIDPSNPSVKFVPASAMGGLGGASAAPEGGVAGTVSPVNTASAPSGGLAGTATPAAPQPSTAPVQQPAALPAASPATAAPAPKAIDFADPSTPATTTVPAGYVPPNQARLVGPFANADAAKVITAKDGERLSNYQDAADKATAAQSRIAQMNDSMATLPASGALSPGQFADERVDAAKLYNLAAGVIGAPQIDANTIGNMEDLRKNTMRLGTEMIASTNGAREAGFILQKSIQNTGGIDNTKAGYQKIVAGYDAANRYTQDKAAFMSDFYTKWGHLQGAQQEFDAVNPWQRYAAQAIQAGESTAAPPSNTLQTAPAPRNGIMGGGASAPASNTPPAPPIQQVAPSTRAAQQGANDNTAPVAGARQAPDGNWYVSDPARPGKYLMVNH